MSHMPDPMPAIMAEASWRRGDGAAPQLDAAAGRGESTISMDDIKKNLTVGMRSARALLECFLRATG